MVRERVGSVRAVVCVAGVLTGSVVTTAVLAWATQWVRTDSVGDADFEVWVGRLAACGALLAVLWLTLGFLVAVIAAVRGSAGDLWERLATRIAPAAVRRAAQFAAGSLLMPGTVVAAGVPAVADSLSPPTPPMVCELPDLDRPFLPGAETTEGQATAQPTSPNARQPRSPGAHPADAEDHPAPHVVTVGAGDTLWDIAADRLGQDATTADIAAEWRRWFVANRQVIGDDPDLIYPGERLAPP